MSDPCGSIALSVALRPATIAFAMWGLMHTGTAPALELRGVALPERIVVESTELVLNGAGVHTEASMDRYVVGLYLTRQQSRLDTIMADRGRKRIVLAVLRTTATARLIETLVEAMEANLSESERESVKAPLDELYAMIGTLGMAKAGTSIAFDYVPGAGTRIWLPAGGRGGVIRGIELYQAVLRAWLGADPVDRGLRGALLGERGRPGTH